MNEDENENTEDEPEGVSTRTHVHRAWAETATWIVVVACITLIVLFRGCDGCVGGKSSCIDKCPRDSNMAACVEACAKAYQDSN